MARRTLNWSAALRDFKDDRAARSEVREERLKSTSGLRGSPAIPLSAWRGRSGRRYVVGVHQAHGFGPDEMAEAVVVGVHRDEQGQAQTIDIASNLSIGLASDWIAEIRAAGGTEMHVHRLAESEAERAAIVDDLVPEAR